jgi:RNA polymerase sigma-70 factor (ECF subfamily)
MSDLRSVHGRDAGSTPDESGAIDHDEFSRLVVQTRPALTSLAQRVARNHDDASEIVQEAYLRAWRARARFRRDAEPTTWLWAIVRNTAYSHVSRRRSWDPLDDLPHDPAGSVSGGEPEAASDQAALRSQLLDAIDQLPPRLRSVVVLKDFDGMAHEEVARHLDVSVPAARVRLHRARRRLHDVLRESQPAPDTADTTSAAAPAGVVRCQSR